MVDSCCLGTNKSAINRQIAALLRSPSLDKMVSCRNAAICVFGKGCNVSLINPKVIIVAAILIAILLIAQAGAQTATQLNFAPNNPSPFQSVKLGNVDKSICDKIQQVLGNKDPCKWSLDNAAGMLKLMVGERIVASVKYTKMAWSELDQMIQTAVQAKAAQLVNKDFWTGYVEVDASFQNVGIGTYVFKSGESILRSGLLRLILDVDNWLEYNQSIPSNAINVLPQLFVYIK